MRRAALRGCALLLRRGGDAGAAAVEPAALAAAGVQAATCGRQLWAPWLQAPFHAAAPLGQAGSDDTGSIGGDDAEWVGRKLGGGKLKVGTPLRVRPELAAELRPLAELAGVADAGQLSRAVAAIGPTRERGVLQHGTSVAELLLSLGVPRPQLAALLLRCPLLFSWPADARPAVLFGELAQLELTAAQAARCFERQPAAAGMPSFKPAIAVLASLFAAGSKAGSSQSGELLLGDLLRKQPAAIGLLALQPSLLQQRISNLVQRYGPHWQRHNKQAVIVTALHQQWSLLNCPLQHLLALEAVLQQEVGQQPGDGRRLLATVVRGCARAASCSPETLRQRVQALLAEFGLERLLQAGPQSLAGLLHIDMAVWQRALAVWRLLGVADPAALGLRNTRSLTLNWLASDRLASLAALQQLLPWQPSVADAVHQFSGYVANYAPPRLMGRLLFLQQEGVLPLLVADKAAAKRQWQQQRRLRAGQAAEEPLFISLNDAVNLDGDFLALLAFARLAGRPEQQSGSSRNTSFGSGTGVSTVAGRYQAFYARLPHLPAYQQLLAAGEAESRRLAALLPPELGAAARSPAAAGRQAGSTA